MEWHLLTNPYVFGFQWFLYSDVYMVLTLGSAVLTVYAAELYYSLISCVWLVDPRGTQMLV